MRKIGKPRLTPLSISRRTRRLRQIRRPRSARDRRDPL